MMPHPSLLRIPTLGTSCPCRIWRGRGGSAPGADQPSSPPPLACTPCLCSGAGQARGGAASPGLRHCQGRAPPLTRRQGAGWHGMAVEGGGKATPSSPATTRPGGGFNISYFTAAPSSTTTLL